MEGPLSWGIVREYDSGILRAEPVKSGTAAVLERLSGLPKAKPLEDGGGPREKVTA